MALPFPLGLLLCPIPGWKDKYNPYWFFTVWWCAMFAPAATRRSLESMDALSDLALEHVALDSTKARWPAASWPIALAVLVALFFVTKILMAVFAGVSHLCKVLERVQQVSPPRLGLRNRSASGRVAAGALMLLLAVSPARASSGAVFLGAVEDGQPCDLRCWLHHLVFVIPDIEKTVSGFDIEIKDLTCHGIDFQDIDSKFVPPTQLQFGINGVGSNCTTKWKYREQKFPHLHGEGTASVHVADASVSAGLKLLKDSDGLVDRAEQTACDLEIAVIDMKFKGGITGFILQLLRHEIEKLIRTEGKRVGCAASGDLIATNLTAAFVDVNKFVRPYLHPDSHAVMPVPVPPGSVSLQGTTDMALLGWAVNSLVGADGILGLDKLADLLTDGSGAVSITDLGEYSRMSVALGPLANVTVGVHQVNVSGLNTWKFLRALVPISPYVLSNVADLGDFGLNASFYVNVTLPDNGRVQGLSLLEEATFALRMKDNRFNVSLQLALSEERLRSIEGNQMTVGCACDLVNEANLVHAWFNTTPAHIGLYAESGTAEADVDAFINNVLDLFVTSFGPAIPAFLNGLVEGPGRAALNMALTSTLTSQKREPCPEPEATSNDLGIDYTAVAVSTPIATLLWVAIVALVLLVERGSFAAPPAKEEARLLGGASGDGPPRRPWWQDSLLFHPALPLHVRLVLPGLILYCVCLFIIANVTVGASVYPIVTAGRRVQLPSLFDFSLGNTVHDMWQSGVYPLAILVAVFSGGWPYVKLVAMGFGFCAPARIIRPAWREKIFMALDALGKWSLIDAYVMTLMVVAFRFHLASPAEEGAPEGTVTIDVVVNPRGGFYVFLVATMASLVISHLLTAAHRAASQGPPSGPKAAALDDGHALPVMLQAFRMGHRRMRVTRVGRWVVALLTGGTLVTVLIGMFIRSFIFQFEGAAALALEFVGEPTDRKYSIWTLGMNISDSLLYPGGPGAYFVQIVFMLFTIAIPIVFLTLLFVLWTAPLRPTMQRRWYVVAEILNAWCALDVVVVSVLVALIQIKKFALFLIGDRCDEINKLLEQFFDGPLHGQDTCFSVDTTLDKGCWMLFAAACVYLNVGAAVMALCHKAIEERDEEAKAAAAAACAGIARRTQATDASEWTVVRTAHSEVAKRGRCTGCLRGLVAGLLRLHLLEVLDEEPPSLNV